MPSGNQICLHSGSVESQGECAQVRNVEPFLGEVAEGPCLPITKKEVPAA